MYVYVSSYGFGPSSPDSVGLSVYRFDQQTGALALVQQVTGDYPSWITIDPARRFLYAVYAGSDGTTLVGSAAAYAIDPSDGTVTAVNRVSLGASGPAQAAVSPDGRHLVVANYYYAQYVVLPIGSDGGLGAISGTLTDTGSGPNPRQDAAHPHAVVFDPAGRFIGAADLGSDKVQTLRLVGGGVELVSEVPVTSGMGPRHVAFSTDSRRMYALGELDGNITAFAYDAATGKLGDLLQTVSSAPSSYTGIASGAELAVHPSGEFLYASNRGSQTVVGYRIDRRTGELTLINFATQGVNGPTNFGIDPSGRWLYVNSGGGNAIVQFDIDARTGDLTPSGQTTSLFAPNVMAFRPADCP
ncbi:MAG TPA: lactonase family protein [Pseudonocardiaceae bacterium]|nr:lactonase family protein [Pseudonocardiaceae bacterium]